MSKKINVESADYKDCDSELDRLYVYRSLCSLLADIKVSQGPLAVSATLRRHRILSDFLLDYQKCAILDLESKVKLFNEVS